MVLHTCNLSTQGAAMEDRDLEASLVYLLSLRPALAIY
jgi:hypothetical protein